MPDVLATGRGLEPLCTGTDCPPSENRPILTHQPERRLMCLKNRLRRCSRTSDRPVYNPRRPGEKKEMIKISNFINYKSLSLRHGMKKISVRPMGLEPISPAPSAANMICQQVGTIARRPHDHDYTHAPSWIKKRILTSMNFM